MAGAPSQRSACRSAVAAHGHSRHAIAARLGKCARLLRAGGHRGVRLWCAIVPFLHGGVVQEMHWLTERQFLDAVPCRVMSTPGPVVITVAFIGYLAAGPLGACAAAVGVFVPVYLVVIAVARWFHKVAQSRGLRAAVDGVTRRCYWSNRWRRDRARTPRAGGRIDMGHVWSRARVCPLHEENGPEPVLILAAGIAGMALSQ